MSANNIVVFEEQEDNAFMAYHRDVNAWAEGQYLDTDERPIFWAATMRECVEKYNKWSNDEDDCFPFNLIVEYGYEFVFRAD